jgi:rhodanese-related sulfurtransferase
VKNLVIVGVLALTAAGASAQNPGGTTKASAPAAAAAATSRAHVLSREEFDKLLAHPQNLLLIDVRRPDEVSKVGGLPVYLSIQLADVEKDLAWIPKDRTIVTISNHAKRAGTAADLLADKGFRVAGAVGVQTYEKAGGTPPASTAKASPNG